MDINLHKFGRILVSRDLAKKIFTGIEAKDKEINLNFKDVDIVTPSFSHEMIMSLSRLKPKKQVNFIDANPSVKTQLKRALVSASKSVSM